MNCRTAITAALLCMPLAAAAQTPTGCKETQHRQFDFWIGEWTVTNAAGQTMGHNVIRSILDGCALEESWTGARGGNGKSFNFFERGRWHQVWVSNSAGGILRLQGALETGAMVMTGESSGPNGQVLNRIRWEKLEGGKVRQTWDVSSNGGQTWQTSFQGVYSRTSASGS
ncbi:MAG: hypothetical protein ACRENP_04970 [Longimicrobiales bacterium]